MILQSKNTTAILCSLVSASLFSFTHVVIKFVSQDMHAYHIAFWNDVSALITVLLLSRWLGGIKNTLHSSNKKYHLLRALGLTMGYLVLIISLTKMPIADAYSLFFTAPILGIILALIFLKEKAKMYHIISLLMGFLGILIILRPGFAALDTDMFYPLFAAMMFALSMVFGRKIPESETKLSFAFYPIIVTLIVTGILTASNFAMPSFNNLALLSLSGFMAGFAVLLAGLAYSYAKAAVVAPFEYIQMVWGVLFGFLFFQDILSGVVALGSIMIICSGLNLIYHEK